MEIEEEALGQASSGPSSMAVAFRPPPRGVRDSISSSEDAGSLGVYSDEEDDLPYPGFLAITWRCLHQTTAPRNYCLAMITNPYPFVAFHCYSAAPDPCHPHFISPAASSRPPRLFPSPSGRTPQCCVYRTWVGGSLASGPRDPSLSRHIDKRVIFCSNE